MYRRRSRVEFTVDRITLIIARVVAGEQDIVFFYDFFCLLDIVYFRIQESPSAFG